MKKLIAFKMSLLMIPLGTKDGLRRGLQELATPGRLLNVASLATEWVELVLRAVRESAEPNPWKNADDEAIAGEILKRIEEKKEKS